jgi:type I restriction enzyme M protein
MLDQDTKRRIDTARDILVGKLPNPQAQVEQITIAMIYKFMDDMDKEAMEFGGEATFFTGEFEKYSWTKIFDPKLGGFEMLALYGEAIVKLNQNPSIPQLFRDIFKNAFLPYRDPETLKMFLKIINEFHYDHSEKLGDAFEYLLSVLGSQGDAGQFRTPRHIIDFIVAIMQPKKEESICDPACGTAGFLISSYKHILSENTKKNKGDLLTPDDRKKLINNFVGYDISAEMVRLSLVNLYLHGFTTPKIFEYDTLTSEDRWGDYFDIILANPPFMTPKGGIRPHKKFAMQANRSEVLFVDYIMEHINPTTGRAGIIVPEGIIFQGATAYKALRKLLVDKNYLYGVISLPAGIFQPYSGVKTSILLLDKSLAKKSNKILFVKIENDGFALGAQRKELSTSDLPDAINFIKQYNTALRNDDFSSIDFENLPLNSLVIDKSKIAENDDYNLSSDRYRISATNHNTKFELVELGEVCNIFNGATPLRSNEEFWKDGEINWFTIEDIREQGRIIRTTNQKITKLGFESSSVKLLPPNTVLLCCTASVGEYAITEVELTTNQQFNGLVVNDDYKDKLLPKFLFHLASTFKEELIRLSGKTSFNFVSVGTLRQIKIPLPPLAVQQEIVSKIEQYEKLISGATQVIENFNPQIDINPEWEIVTLENIADVTSSRRIFQNEYVDTGIPFYRTKEIVELNQGKEISLELFISNERYIELKKKNDIPKKGDLLISAVGTLGVIWVIPDDREFYFKDGNLIWVKDLKNINSNYLRYVLEIAFSTRMAELSNGAAYNALTIVKLKQLPIPLPSLAEQEAIIEKIEKEQSLVNSNKELIILFEQKVKDEINKLWAE